MAESFVLTAQLQTQLHTASVRRTISDLRRQLSGIDVRVKVTGTETIKKEMDAVKRKTKDASGVLQDFGKQGALAAKRFAAFSIATAGFVSFVSALRNGIKQAIDFERQMIRISQVTGNSMNQLSDLRNEITRLSTGLGVSSEKLVDISRTLAQTGMTARDTKVALEALAKTELAPTFTSIEKTTEAAIAAMRQFNIEASQLSSVLGQMNALAGNFAVEADDLGVVIRRAGGAFKAAGGDLLELEALFTSVRSTTRESAETIATGFRTIFTRMRRPRTIGFLKELGVNLEDMEGKFVGPYEAVRRLNAALSELDPRDTRYAQIIEELGGFRQVSKVIPLIQQFEQAELARAAAIRGSASLTRDALSAQDALAIRLAKLSERFQEFMRSLLDNKGIQVFIELSLRLAEALLKVAESLEPMIPLLGVLGASALFKGGGKMFAGAKSGLGMNKGGMVPGVGNTDTVPAMLTPGEFVIRKSVAQRLGADQLNSMNRYAAGGVVRKGRHAYGSGKATVEIGSTEDPKFGGLFLRPDVADKKSRASSKGFAVGKPKGLLASLIAKKAGVTGPKRSQWANTLAEVRAKVPTSKYYVGPPESGKYADIIEQEVEAGARKTVKKVADDLAKNVKGLEFNQKAHDAAIKHMDLPAIQGHMFEGIISSATGSALTKPGAGWDYLRGGMKKEGLSSLFGTIRNEVALDAKRTDNDSARQSLRDKIQAVLAKGRKSNVLLHQLGVGLDDIKLDNNARKSADKFKSQGLGDKKTKKSTSAIIAAARKQGGPRKRLNRGGVVDSVPALLTPGEFVINKASAQAIGYGNLNHINKYAAGGVVRKGRGRYGPGSGPDPEGKGGGDKFMKFMVIETMMGMVAGMADAESTLGKIADTGMKVVSTFMMLQMMGGDGGIAGLVGKAGGSISGMGARASALSTRMQFGKLGPTGFPMGAMPGKWSQRGGRIMSGMGKGLSKAGGAVSGMAAKAGPALLVGMIGGAVGDMVKQSGLEDVANDIAAGGEVSGWTQTKAVGGGAISGAATGAAVGMLFGPVGAAVGGVVGGLIGMTKALWELEDATQAAKISFESKELSDQMRNVERGFADAASIGPQLTETFNVAAAGMHGDEQTKKAAGEAVKQASPAMEKFIKTIEKDATSMDEFMSRVDESTLRTYAELNNIPYDKLTESIEKNIKAHEDARVAAEKQKQASLELEALQRNLKNVNVATEVASDSIDMMGARARVAAGGSAGFKDLTKGTISRPGDLSQAEMAKGGRMEQEIGRITSVLPEKNAKEMRERTIDASRALGNLKDTLIGVRTDMATGGLGEDDDAKVLIEKRLKAAGIGDAARDTIMAGLNESYSGEQGKKALRDAINNGKLDEVIANASKGIKNEFETLKKVAALINKTTKAIESAYKARLQIEKRLVGEYQKLHSMEKNRIAKMKQIRTGKGLSPEESEGIFQRQNAALLQRQGMGGLAAGGTVDLDRTIKAFHALDAAIKANEIQMREGAASGAGELDRRTKLMQQNNKMREQMNTLNTVLKKYTNVQERAAALESKINKIRQDNAMRLGGVDEYIGATDEARAEMDKVAVLANQISLGTSRFSDVPEELRGSVLQLMKQMSGVEGPQGERFKRGVESARFERLAAAGIDISDPNVQAMVREQETPELERLGDKLESIFKEGENAQLNAFIKQAEDQKKALDKQIVGIGEQFKKALQGTLLEEEKEQNKKLIKNQESQLAKLEEHSRYLAKLAGMGVDVEDPAALRAAKSLAGEKGEENLVQKTRRLESQLKFQEAVGQTGDQSTWASDFRMTDILEGEGGTGGLMGVAKGLIAEGESVDIDGAHVMVKDNAALSAKVADRTLEMAKASLAIEQGRADVAATGKGAAEQAQMEAALAEMAKTGKGDFEATMKQLADAAQYQSSKDYLNNLSAAVGQGVEQQGQQLRTGVSGAFMSSEGNVGDFRSLDAIGEILATGLKKTAEQVKRDAEQSRKLLDQKLGTMTKDEDKKAELEETFAGRTADDRKFLARARASDPSMTKSKTDAEKQNLQTSIAGLKTANQNIATALKKLPGSPDGPPNAVEATGAFKDLVEAGKNPGSIYTHDTHVEAALVSTNGLLADILSAVQGSGGKSSNGNGGGGWASLASAMETFNPSATALTTSLNAFNTNFAGGMKWTLESKHTIKLDGIDGLAIFSSLEGAFSSLVVDTVEALITEQLDERLPQLTKKAKQKPMGTNE